MSGTVTPILILTHGELGSVLLHVAQGMYGALADVQALAMGPHEGPEDYAVRVQQAARGLHGQPLVLVDLACGTPWNVACKCGLAQGGEVLAGLSLPLLLEALGLRDGMPPKEMAAELVKRVPTTFLRASVLLTGTDTGACQ